MPLQKDTYILLKIKIIFNRFVLNKLNYIYFNKFYYCILFCRNS